MLAFVLGPFFGVIVNRFYSLVALLKKDLVGISTPNYMDSYYTPS